MPTRGEMIVKGLQPVSWDWVKEALWLRREHGVRLQDYEAARRSRLHMLPGSIEVTSGLVVDLGANAGNWTANLIKAVPSAEVLAVEPFPPAFARVKERFASNPNVHLDHRAVAAEIGSAAFHVSKRDVFGSLLASDPALLELYGDFAETTDVITVQTVALDELVGERPVSLLKIDVQGAELQVLAGGRRTLAATQAVLAEVNFVGLYEGGSRFAQVDAALTEHGFGLWDMDPPFRRGHGRAIWSDAMYVRLGSHQAGSVSWAG